MSVRAAAAGIIAADFSAVHIDSPLQRSCRQQLSGFRRRCCAVNCYKWRHNSVIDEDVINFVVLCRSIILITRFGRLQCLIKLLLVFSVCYCVLNYDYKSADNVCLQLLTADCQALPLRISHSAVRQQQPILASSCADWHTLNLYIP